MAALKASGGTAMTRGEAVGVFIFIAGIAASLVWLFAAPVAWVTFCVVGMGFVLWAGIPK